MTQDNAEERRAQLRRAALEYHEFPTPAKSPLQPPSNWSISTTWLWPTRQVWQRRAKKLSKTPTQHSNTPAAVIWSG